MNDPILLKRFSSIMEAELAKSLLESQNINCIIKNAGLKFVGDLGDGYGADLFVLEKNIEKAKKILEQKESK
jgi:hypothetical protein